MDTVNGCTCGLCMRAQRLKLKEMQASKQQEPWGILAGVTVMDLQPPARAKTPAPHQVPHKLEQYKHTPPDVIRGWRKLGLMTNEQAAAILTYQAHNRGDVG